MLLPVRSIQTGLPHLPPKHQRLDNVRINRCKYRSCIPVGPASSAALFGPSASRSANPNLAGAYKSRELTKPIPIWISCACGGAAAPPFPSSLSGIISLFRRSKVCTTQPDSNFSATVTIYITNMHRRIKLPTATPPTVAGPAVPAHT
jgi:hypothetical protein